MAAQRADGLAHGGVNENILAVFLCQHKAAGFQEKRKAVFAHVAGEAEFKGFPAASAAGKISSCKGVMNFPYPYIVFTHGNIHFENTVGIYSDALAVKFHIKNHNVRCI